jgi:molybdate transport system permease protein
MYSTAKGAFEQIDKNILNAAQTMGVSNFKIFWKIMIPLAWPGIAAGTILSFARALGEFGATLMIAGNIPGKTQTIPLAIYFAAEGGDIQGALTWVYTIFGISLFTMIMMNFWNNYQRKITGKIRN